MRLLQLVAKFCFYTLFILVLIWFALVSWVYLAPIKWLANHAQTGFINQQLNSQGQDFVRQISWRNLTGSLGNGSAQEIVLPQAKLENPSWQLSFFSLLIAKPVFKLTVKNAQVISPLSLSLGSATANLEAESRQAFIQLAKQQQAKFNWQLSLSQPEEHLIQLEGSLTPKLYSFKGTADVSTSAQLMPAMQLLNWRKTTNQPSSFSGGESFQGRGSGRF